ncbi:hypothetical protein [Microbacterium capsulatum]|uniref:Secreted protein n=1 Tax=Microbacterium capsulatum TaxID=3041921 RepID=A0ABU0XHM8_9MICO|nr:hypothetical protein [Microbacterium sp. ASV81]MDQ4214068.1 hypothetical protein [Microbacterium sp. ASV81]
MKSIKAPGIALIVVALITVCAPAHAATPRFPDIPGAPSWYNTAPSAPYAKSGSTSTDQHSAQDQKQWYASAWWYSPDGSAPDPAEGDITVETMKRESWEPGSTDPNLVTLSLNAAFPKLIDSIGTKLTTGVEIPPDAPGAGPTLTFPGDGIIVAQRPARDCLVTNNIKDQDRFRAGIAMLGANLHKYLVTLTVQFGARSWQDACANAVAAKPAEEKPPSKSVKDKKPDEIKKSAAPGPAAPEESGGVQDVQGQALGAIALVIAILVTALVGMFVWGRFRSKHKPKYENDGTPIRAIQQFSDEHTAKSSDRSRHGDRW